MTDSTGQQFVRLLASEDTRFAEISDPALDGVLRKGQDEMVRLLRTTMNEIGRLPDAGPACEAKRRAKLTWLASVLAALEPCNESRRDSRRRAHPSPAVAGPDRV